MLGEWSTESTQESLDHSETCGAGVRVRVNDTRTDLMTLKDGHSSKPRSIIISVSMAGRSVAVRMRLLILIAKQAPIAHTARNIGL